MAVNKFKRFQSVYTPDIDSNTNSGDNYLTDDELIDSTTLFQRGIPYQAAATSDILNALLRQVTAITTTVADLIATDGKVAVNSLTDPENLLEGLRDAIESLSLVVANNAIQDSLDKITTAGVVGDNTTKALTSAAVKRSIKNPTNAVGFGALESGYILDAAAGKVLWDKIAAEETARANGIKSTEDKITALKNELKLKALPANMTTVYNASGEDGFLYIWRGSQVNWGTFSGLAANSALLPNVLTIITD